MLLRRRILSLSASSLRTCSSCNGNTLYSTYPSHFSSYAKPPDVAGGVLVHELKDWFKRDLQPPQSNQLLINRIFDILRAPSSGRDDRAFYNHLSSLRLRLTERFVLDVLYQTRTDILSCLKFFDWAARQPGFYHTRATFHAIFKILRKAKLMNLMSAFLERSVDFENFRYSLRLCDALVIGYAVAGRTDIALQEFGNMRFRGLDLDTFGYHVLLNALVEDNCFDSADVIFDQIATRGFICSVTHSIVVKKFCKLGQFDEAEAYIRSLLSSDPAACATALDILVAALCSKKKFQEAMKLLDEIKMVGTVHTEVAYSIWVKALTREGLLNNTEDFMQKISPLEGSKQEAIRYNSMIFKLLKQKDVWNVYDILTQMMVRGVSPTQKTMDAALCFLCKAGLVDEALELYQSRSDIGFAPTAISYNYLIHTLCADGNVEQAYDVWKGAMDRRQVLGSKTFGILTNALCSKGKLDMAKELVIVAVERDILPKHVTGCEIVSALCDVGKVEEALSIYELYNKSGVATNFNMFKSLIFCSVRSMMGDLAAKLIIRMQDMGYSPSRLLYRNVIRCVCAMDSGEKILNTLLNSQLSRWEHNVEAYNFFIDGAGYAGKPKLARLVYDTMVGYGIRPTLSSNILMLQSYLKNEKIDEAVHFFRELCQKRKVGRRFYHVMIVGMCKADRVDEAMLFLDEMKGTGKTPSIECYEVIIQKLCKDERYEEAVKLVKEFTKSGWRITSFIGNVLLDNAMKSRGVYKAWTQMRDVEDKIPEMKSLGELIGLFSGKIEMVGELKLLDEVIEKCYPLDMYTYNMLLRRVVMDQAEDAFEFVDRISQKGYEPNEGTSRILVRARHILERRNIRRGNLNAENMSGRDQNC